MKPPYLQSKYLFQKPKERNRSLHSFTNDRSSLENDKSFDNVSEKHNQWKIQCELTVLKQMINKRKSTLQQQEEDLDKENKPKRAQMQNLITQQFQFEQIKHQEKKIQTQPEKQREESTYQDSLKGLFSKIKDLLGEDHQQLSLIVQRSERKLIQEKMVTPRDTPRNTTVELLQDLIKDCIIPALEQNEQGKYYQKWLSNAKDITIEDFAKMIEGEYLGSLTLHQNKVITDQIKDKKLTQRLIISKGKVNFEQHDEELTNAAITCEEDCFKEIHVLRVKSNQIQKLNSDLNLVANHLQLTFKFKNQQRTRGIQILFNKMVELRRVTQKVILGTIQKTAKRKLQQLEKILQMIISKEEQQKRIETNCKQFVFGFHIVKYQQYIGSYTLSNLLEQTNKREMLKAFTLIQEYQAQQNCLQGIQLKGNLCSYLKEIYICLQEKLMVAVLNKQLSTLTVYIPDHGLIQEYYQLELRDIDVKQFEVLHSITQSISIIFNQMFEDIIFQNRHIWPIDDNLYLITISNLQTYHLQEIANILINQFAILNQQILTVFKTLNILGKSFRQRIQSRYLNFWRKYTASGHQKKLLQEQLESSVSEREMLDCKLKLQKLELEQELLTKREMTQQEEINMLQIENEIKQKCLSSALLHNWLVKKQASRNNILHTFSHWKSFATFGSNRQRSVMMGEEKHLMARFQSGIFLMKLFTKKALRKIKKDGFRTLAFIQNTSPYKNSFNGLPCTPVNQCSPMTQLDSEQQSILWEIHQMHNNNTSFEVDRNYHSQRLKQSQVWSKKAKDFQKRVSGQSHQRVYSTCASTKHHSRTNTTLDM